MANYTNRPENIEADPMGWTPLPSASDPNVAPEFPRGATEPTMSAPGAQQLEPGAEEGDMTMQPAMVPADPRLGMNPQGEWTGEKAQAMFPEMFQDTSQWLDPAEEAKKREGLPYDETKRYDEKKPVEGYTPPGAGGAPVPQGPPTRTQFEEAFFKQHGNPFMMDPYAEVVKSDKSLPKLFNQAFQGQVVWSDLPKLSKEQRAFWEDVKKQHHERSYKAAVAKQKQLKGMYDMMMTRFDHEEKTRRYEEGKREKAQIRADAKADKVNEFTLHEALNERGIKTWQRFYKDGRVEDTGKTGVVNAEDHMTAAEKFVKSTFEKTAGGIDPRYEPVINMMAEGPEKEKFKKQFTIALTQDQKDTHEKLRPAYLALINRLAKVGVAPPVSAQPAAKGEAPNAGKDIMALVGGWKRKHPKFAEGEKIFLNTYKDDKAALRRYRDTMRKLGREVTIDTAGAGEAY
jgi:hypothetical protein